MSFLRSHCERRKGMSPKQQTNTHTMHKHTTVVEVPFTEWHRAVSTIIATGAIVASGFYQVVCQDGSVLTHCTAVPAIYVGDMVVIPAPIVP